MEPLRIVTATTTEERIMANVKRLELDLWAANNGEVINEILALCEDYVLGLDETFETATALVNLQTSIIMLERYFRD